MGQLKRAVAHLSEQLDLEREHLEDMKSGKTTLHEDIHDGRGPVDVTDKYLERSERLVNVLADVIQTWERPIALA